ncbi:MAG: hypothetical protein HY810_07010 [Candidatus Omnitrophica bacterium]|nr:hypothetical protein [Candidatus Omnitrophota bacterium]
MNKEQKQRKRNFLEWLFEEVDEDEKDSDKEGEYEIEISLGQIIAIIVITLLFVFWIIFSYTKNPGVGWGKISFSPQGYIEQKIEKNYFQDETCLINSNFSDGLKHWATSDGGSVFPDSKSKAILEKKDFYSAPYALKIKTIAPANRYFYIKKDKSDVINNPYNYLETDHWLGILPGVKVRGSFWYKGDIVMLALEGLTHDGNWQQIKAFTGPKTDVWSKLEIKTEIPEICRAVALSITINQAKDMPLPEVLIDDVELFIE